MLKKLKEGFDTFFDKLDISKRYPLYVTKFIFRFFILIIILMGATDLALNYSLSGTFYSYELSCPEYYYSCPNPFYEAPLNDRLCDAVLCNEERLPSGFQYGRTDILAKYGLVIMFSLIVLAFVLNHLYWMWRKKD